ncbi:MAG: glycoside hydrolase family 3 C-terminal domain-containing protein [Siculibacillus sp.]|nr:glycoside hydrolase family 3 C-terminal domain-containing protein [Siculibacillus sp.]
MSRIDDLISTMTLDEKIGQLIMISLGADTIVTGPKAAADPSVADVRAGRCGSVLNLVGRDRIHALQKLAIEETRLGIPLIFGLDVIHGYHTAFPVPLGETAAFRPDVWRESARIAAEEAADDGLHLTFAPMLDLARDPRWGRIIEGPGEDPHVGRMLARAKVEGFQSADLARRDAIAATAKHFVAYGACTAGRDYAAVDISERMLHEAYLPAFEAAVRAGTLAIMPAFIDIAGRPLSGDKGFLTDLVRTKWGWEGIYVSDYDAIGELIAHGVAADFAEAAALALKAGMDIDMQSRAYPEGLKPALERGLIAMDDIDAAVRRVLAAKERLGLFDDPYGRGSVAGGAARPLAARRAAARDAAVVSMVLAKNDGLLPLAKSGGPIALIGHASVKDDEALGSWFALGDMNPITGLADGIRAAFPDRDVIVERGCDLALDGPSPESDDADIARAVEAAKKAEVVLLAIGEPALLTGEAASRTRIRLTGRQEELARAVLATGKPVVLLLGCGRPLTETWLYDAVGAVLITWYLGSEAGAAIGDVVSGARSPSGRLPVSWPRHVGQIPIFYNERPSGRPWAPGEHFTTRWVDSPNTPLWPFGHGLSYTSFEISAPRAPATFRPGESLTVEVDVADVGDRDGATTVFLFLRDRVASTTRPIMELKRFETVDLAVGERRTLRLTLEPEDFFCLGPDMVARAEPGVFDLLVGESADREKLKGIAVTLLDEAAVA